MYADPTFHSSRQLSYSVMEVAGRRSVVKWRRSQSRTRFPQIDKLKRSDKILDFIGDGGLGSDYVSRAKTSDLTALAMLTM